MQEHDDACGDEEEYGQGGADAVLGLADALLDDGLGDGVGRVAGAAFGHRVGQVVDLEASGHQQERGGDDAGGQLRQGDVHELLESGGAVDGRLFVQVVGDGLQECEVEGGVPADLGPNRDEDDAELRPGVVAEPGDRVETERDEHGVDHAGLHRGEDVLPYHAHDGQRRHGEEEEHGAYEVASHEFAVEHHGQWDGQRGHADRHHDGVEDRESEAGKGRWVGEDLSVVVESDELHVGAVAVEISE